MKLIPTKKQFRNWSLPSKIGYISFVITIVAIIISVIFFFVQINIGASKKGQEVTHDKLDTIDGKLSEAMDSKKYSPLKELQSKQRTNDRPVDGITKLVSTLEKFLSEDEAEIKSPDYIEDHITGKLRKVDISINKVIGSFPVLIIIECKNESVLDDTLWVEQIAQKRDAIRASKAVAVFSNYLSDSALEKASYLNIETRLLAEVTLDDISNWFKVQYLTQWLYRADFLRISFRTEQDKQEQLNKFISSNFSNLKLNNDSDIFLNKKDNKKYSFNHVWRGMLSKKREEIYKDVKQSDKKVRRTLFSSFSNPESRYQIITNEGPVDILEIKTICDLWIEEKHIPFTNLSKYSSREDQLFDSVGAKIEANGTEFNMNIHRNLKTGQMYLSVNGTSKIDVALDEINEDTVSEENRKLDF